MSVHPFLLHDGPIPIVHRGAPHAVAGPLVENTSAAFRRAYERGFRWFETDVHATRDGHVVISHDASLRRVAGTPVRISAVDWAELATVAVGGAPLPRLRELFDDYPDVRINIDPKADGAVPPLVDLLRSAGVLERVCVASFSDRRLRWVRAALGRDVCTAAGPRELGRAVTQLARGAELALSGVEVLQIPRSLARWSRRLDLVAGAQRVGLPVHVWTVNDEQEMEHLLSRGVDGVMSDDVDALARVFGVGP